MVTANLECAVTDYPKPVPKTFNFKLSPRHVAPVLGAARFRFVSLANNHSLDYYEPGLVETTRTLDAHGIAYAGVGYAEQAAEPAIVEQGGVKVAFLAYSDHYAEWAATEKKRGINFIDPETYDLDKLAQQLRGASEKADLVIVFVHWGPNWAWLPTRDIQRLAHDFVECGASAVFGHSAHHVQGIEVWQGRPIIYGAGGFIDDYALDKNYRNDLGCIYELKLEEGRPVALELIPTHIVHSWRREVPTPHPPYFSSVQRATGEDRAWVMRTVQRLSKDLGTKTIRETSSGLAIPLLG